MRLPDISPLQNQPMTMSFHLQKPGPPGINCGYSLYGSSRKARSGGQMASFSTPGKSLSVRNLTPTSLKKNAQTAQLFN